MANILLVDDSATDRQLFKEILQRNAAHVVAVCEDGAEALTSIDTSLPDVVVTDMQMPNMDGLELVKHIRDRYPKLPVILVTGIGSESLATKALRAGAAGYVPKSHTNDLLTDTIQHVLELTYARDVDERVHAATSLVHYELQLDNDETLIPGLQQLVRQRLDDCGKCDAASTLQVGVAIEHAVRNAIYHGNLDFKQLAGVDFDADSRKREAKMRRRQEPFRDRRVHVTLHVTPEEFRCVVRDDGEGFDVKEVSSLGLTRSLRGDFGHGLFLMWAFMDKVVFDKTGNSVTLVKSLQPVQVATLVEPETATSAATATPVVESASPPTKVLASLQSKQGGKPYEITRSRITIGRDPSCDIAIESAAVSHHHCLLFLHEGWWFVRDLRSKNGIKVNGIKQEQHLLPPASVLSVGSHEFEMMYHPHKLGAVGITPPVDPF